ncbi:DUF2911 domain-containing protein [Flavobacterium sp. 5]|uniref:DUF2911 domain-containing protein n=1 Tax=Flavobacterium sp. 5 TaxID=2035199 RepID=UPI000C2BECEE|nr:DUF2911 domain-containing protein [Flavobacterium sp. 5]PKB15692.1 Protein of unknown function (DUF2911) [Flavobacterium sp. 5]
MKKATIIATMAFAMTMVFTSNAHAQKFSDLDKSPMDMASYPNDYKDANKTARIIYGRPQLKGRTLSELAPEGKVWRTGANEAVEITFYKDVKLGNTKIKAGSYTLFTIPEKDSYTVIINKDLNVWGAYTYNEKNDVARLKVPITAGDQSLEAFSMVFTKADNGIVLNLGWDKVRVAVPFTE